MRFGDRRESGNSFHKHYVNMTPAAYEKRHKCSSLECIALLYLCVVAAYFPSFARVIVKVVIILLVPPSVQTILKQSCKVLHIHFT